MNDQDGTPAPEHQDFYDESRTTERNASENAQGGKVSDVQLADNIQPGGQGTGDESTASGVTVAEGGAKRGGYFKKRDYE